MKRLPAIFVSHGGGPWPYIEEMRRAFAGSEREFTRLPSRLPERPKAILSISGHWEEEEFTVATASRPPLIYDYSGFPEHTYHVQYPAPGSPELAARVSSLLGTHGLKSSKDPAHGFDHGTFVPLGLMYPNAEIPVVSLSMKSSYDPEEHLRMGQALQPLRDEGVLIFGSGLTYHNLRKFGPDGSKVSEEFGDWLTEAVVTPDSEKRDRDLKNWTRGPQARLAHPREDHLIPLMVAAGAAGKEPGRVLFTDRFNGIKMWSYSFGDIT